MTNQEQAPETHLAHTAAYPLWLAYVGPMALFMLLTTGEGYLLEQNYLPRSQYLWAYLAKAALVTASLAYFARDWKHEVRFEARVLPAALLVGLLVFAEWILIDKWVPYPHLGQRSAVNPFEAMPDPAVRAAFLAVRFYGLAIMVPIMEEVFWRSFLLRWVTNPDFAKLPVGAFSWGAFAIVSALFGAAHPEWLVGVICGAAYALLLRQTRSLFAVIVAHGVTNLALGIYVLVTGDWKYW